MPVGGGASACVAFVAFQTPGPWHPPRRPQGLPPASKNQHSWPLKKPLLSAAAAYKPPPATIAAAAAFFRALLRVRYSSPLFRMPSAEHVCRQVSFENTGPDQIPGVIVMRLASTGSPADPGTHDPELACAVIVFNAQPAAARVPFPAGAGALELHPALQELAAAGDDAVAACRADGARRELSVAGRVAAVFVERRPR